MALAGCGTAVDTSEPARARDAVGSFLRDCGQGEWVSASRLVTSSTREPWLEHGHPALRCAESLGVDPAAFASASGDSLRRMQAAFHAARVTSVRIRGDQATVRVHLAGVAGEAALENDGEGVYAISTMPRE